MTPDRNGSVADFTNYVSFMQNLRGALDTNLNNVGKRIGLSMTIPSSYWYMQHFDIINFAKTIDWVDRLFRYFYLKLTNWFSLTF